MFIHLLGVYAAACLFSGVIYEEPTARCHARIANVIRYEVQRAKHRINISRVYVTLLNPISKQIQITITYEYPNHGLLE
jgi:hypothetical protein